MVGDSIQNLFSPLFPRPPQYGTLAAAEAEGIDEDPPSPPPHTMAVVDPPPRTIMRLPPPPNPLPPSYPAADKITMSTATVHAAVAIPPNAAKLSAFTAKISLTTSSSTTQSSSPSSSQFSALWLLHPINISRSSLFQKI